ncbi:hypothetical protein AVEN_41691-1, partial [Araneus ventricosus]
MHPSRVCEKTSICPSCGEIHSGICQAPQKCINCQGEHPATSRGCPFYIKEQNILELKGRNHLTTAEARRIYIQSAKFNYAAPVKANTPSNNIEGQINEKMETMLLKMNEKIESITQIINAKMEQQATMLVEMFERLVESLLQNLTAINKLGGVTISPSRKKKAVDNLRKASGIPMQLDAESGAFFFVIFGVFFFFFFVCVQVFSFIPLHQSLFLLFQVVFSEMALVQWNCRGLKNKKIWLKVPPFSCSEFWIFQETFFKHEDHFLCSSKTLFYLDRQDRPGGGLLTGIPKNASGRIIPINCSHNTNQEILAVEVFYKDLNFIIINLYAPQGFNIENAKQFFDSFSVPVFIFGDFNLHHPLWGSDKSSPLSNDFVEWLQNSSFVLLNSSNPTYATHTGSASLLDLSICSASISHGVDCYVSDSNFESDHCPVIITWSKLKYISKIIKTTDWNRTMSQSANVLTTKTNLHVLTRKISEVIRDNTKIITLPANNYPPWWNLSCHNFQKLKILFRKRALRFISESDWIKHKKYAAKLRFHIKKASRNYWDKICNITRNP